MALDKSCPMFIKEKEIRKIMSRQNYTYRKALSVWLEDKKSKRKETDHVDKMDYITSKKLVTTNKTLDQSKSYRDVVVNNSFEGLNVNDEKLYMEKSEDEGNDTDRSQIQLKKKKKMKKRKNQNNQSFEENASEVEHESETCARNSYPKRHQNTIFKKLMSKIKDICFSSNCFEDKLKMCFSCVVKECIQYIFELVQK
ncbi:hypothetical protein PYW08_012989 [Mythimna loreyi]|uniref:Uncharacterized protein n=1 Tax=Mythimna loreyi TaxID=667449 RepID=A0ACC2Q0L0_9NEOP|nr:hypothetical protein PYW08_012989 [Mythimna loreyi]